MYRLQICILKFCMINDLVQFIQIYGWKGQSFGTKYVIHSVEQVTKGLVQTYTFTENIQLTSVPWFPLFCTRIISVRMTAIHEISKHWKLHDCSFIFCTPHQILLGWSNQEWWDGHRMWHIWDRTDTHSRLQWQIAWQKQTTGIPTHRW